MNEKDIRRTILNAKRIGRAELPGYRLVFSQYSRSRNGGVADIISDIDSGVEGILYEIESNDLIALDTREGVAYGLYRRFPVQVRFNGSVIKAFTYEVVRKDLVETAPSKDYGQLILDGGKELSSNYWLSLAEHIKSLQSGQVTYMVNGYKSIG